MKPIHYLYFVKEQKKPFIIDGPKEEFRGWFPLSIKYKLCDHE